MNHLLDFITENWEFLAPTLYELLVRIIPTQKNWSIIDLAIKLIGAVIKNRRQADPKDVTSYNDNKKNIVTVDRTKHIIPVIIFMLVSFTASAQLNGTFKTLRFTPQQDTTILNASPSQFPIGTVTRLANDTLYYKFPDGYWHPLGGGNSGGGGGLTTANNGLTVNPAGNVQLGGTLIANTLINGGFQYRLGPTVPLSVYTVNSTGNLNMTSASGNMVLTAGNGASLIATNGATLNGGTNATVTSADDVDITAGTALDLTAGTVANINAVDDLQVLSDAGTLGLYSLNDAVDMAAPNIAISATTNLDLTATAFLLNSAAPSNPATEFFRGDGTWAVPAGGGGSVTADNGLTETAGNIQLGGALLQNTTIDGAFNFIVDVDDQISLSAVNQLNLTSEFGTLINTTDLGGTIQIQTPTGGTGDITLTSGDLARMVGGASGANQANINASATGITLNATGAGIVSISTTVQDITIQSGNDTHFTNGSGGFIIMNNLPVNCTGAPTGALANVGGTLTVCP